LEHIGQGTLRLCGIGKSSDVISGKLVFEAGDILFGKLRPYFRKVVRPKFSGVCSTDIFVVRAKGGIDQGFLFYWLAEPETIKKASKGSEGTKMPRAVWDYMKNFERLVPKESEQRRIGKILSALDDKIELNNQMNCTLEEMAQAIFKSWFVDFEPFQNEEFEYSEELDEEIPKGWDVVQISDIAKVTSGKRPSAVYENQSPDSPVPVYGGSGVIGYTSVLLFTEPILVTGRVGTLGKLYRANPPSWPSDNTLVVIVKDKCYFEFVYFSLQRIKLESLNRGTSNPLIIQGDIKRQKVVLPPSDTVGSFSSMSQTLFEQCDLNDYESRNLATIRDALLPKLLSGEMRVDTLAETGREV